MIGSRYSGYKMPVTMIAGRLSLHHLFLILWIGSTVHAQQINVTGKVQDQENNSVLTGANVLLKGNETYATISDESGMFAFKGIKAGEYVLQISFIGYETYLSDIKNIQNSFSFGTLHLKVSENPLDEVVVEGKIPIATVKGDTMEYNADAYKTNPDADAEDLVKKMPGIVLQDGKVQAEGEDVKKVYVDGKPFFDQDPTLALKSLPAEVIQNIKVYDEESEQAQFSGFSDGETVKVMDIITRTETKNGQFGKLYFGGGLPDKYQLGSNINYFNEDRRISLIGQSNNINIQNFSTEDLLGITSSSGGRGGGRSVGRPGGRSGGRDGGFGGPGMSGQDFMVGQQAGISRTTAVGFNYSDKWSEKVNVSGSYFFNTSENKRDEERYQEYFTESVLQNQIYTENTNSNSTNYNHRFNFRLEYNMNEYNRLMIMPRLSFQLNQSESNRVGNSWSGDTLLSSNLSNSANDRTGFSISNQIMFSHRFQKRGRTISLNVNTSMRPQKIGRYMMSESIDSEKAPASDSLNQFNDSRSNSNTLSGRVVYTEPIGENSQLMFNVDNTITYENSDRKAYNYDYLSNGYQLFDTSLSNVFTSSYYTQEFGSGYRYRKDKINLNLGLDYERAYLHSEQEFPQEYILDQPFNSLLPNFRFKYNISKTKNLNINYRTRSRAPGVEQLQNTIDNSNPLQLESGNPDLKPLYEHNISLRYRATNKEKATVFFVMGSIRFANNYIGNSTWFASADTLIYNDIILQRGGQFKQPVNLDNYRNIRLQTTYGLPVKGIKSNFNISASYSFTQTPGMINYVLSYSKNNTYGTGLGLSSNISEKIDFTLSSYISYNDARSSLQGEESSSFFNHKITTDLAIIFWKGITFRTTAGSQYYYWTDEKEDEAIFLLNMEVGKKVFKNQLGEIKVAVFDVLAQNKSISRNVTDAYVEDVKSNVLQRFVMFSFNYKIRNFGS
ncbi:MAG: TonB-dependent receptor [Bacteroidales bacterium]|nr:TonB-dependent receptor [Bacteroidales bacterium]